MPNNTLTKLLLGVLLLVAAANVYLAASFNFAFRDLRRAQQTVNNAANVRMQLSQVVQMLASDLIEYSKRNPSIDPLLAQYGIKGGSTNAPARK